MCHRPNTFEPSYMALAGGWHCRAPQPVTADGFPSEPGSAQISSY